MISTYVTYQMMCNIFNLQVKEHLADGTVTVSDMIMSLMTMFLFIRSDQKSVEPESTRNTSAYMYKKVCSVFLPINYFEKGCTLPSNSQRILFSCQCIRF